MIEQQDDQAVHGREFLVAIGARELAARPGREQSPLSVVDHGPGSAGSGRWPMHGTSWPVRISMPARRSIPSREISRRAFERELERIECDLLDPPVGGSLRDGRDVEQSGARAAEQGSVSASDCFLSGEGWVSGRAGGVGGPAEAATVSAAMWSSACAGSEITVIRSHSTDSGAIPMLRFGHSWAADDRRQLFVWSG